MVNNSTNISKINNHISTQIIEHKKMTYGAGNTFLGLEQAQNCSQIKPINGSASGANQN